MEKGDDYIDSFSPVPRAAAMRTIVSAAAAEHMHLHSVDWEQAFIQGDWANLPEDTPAIFIKPPTGWDGAADLGEDVVLQVTRPLYGHPASSRCLHFTVHEFLKSEGFTKAGFEESVWVREAGGKYHHRILLGIHIDDSLIACNDLHTLQHFKSSLLQRFQGTDEGEVTEYLGCKLIRDWENGSITISQAEYARKIVKLLNVDVSRP
eukprot:2865345-Rhodomonas_salina.1